MNYLYEVERRYYSKLVSQVEQYRGRGLWIHFGQTPQMSIHPAATHPDPKGIYFYPLDWLLGVINDHDSNYKFASNYPYWTIVSLTQSPDGIVMSDIDHDRLIKIAKKQKWLDFSDWLEKNSSSNADAYSVRMNKPPTLFWRYVKQNDGKRANTLLRGIPYVIEDGTGSIHTNEPMQLVVLDIRVISIIAKGNQYSGKFVAKSINHIDDNPEIIKNITTSILKELRSRYGGEITYHKSEPELTITGKYSNFVIGLDKTSFSNDGYKMTARWGRAVKTIRIDLLTVKKTPMATVVDFFASVIDHINRLGPRDLFFAPETSIKTAQTIISKVLPKAVLKTEINNSQAYVETIGENIFEEAGIKLRTSVRAYLEKTKTDWFIDGRIALSDKSASWDGIFLSYRATDLSDLSSLRQDMLEKTELHSPTSDLYRKFYGRDDYEAFLGWLCVNSGISALLSNQDWIDQYRRADKTTLMRDISRVYSRY